jgi:hypothetical protein
VAYLTSRPLDPFGNPQLAEILGVPGSREEGMHYSYWRIVTFDEYDIYYDDMCTCDYPNSNVNAFLKYGKWLLFSLGPDGEFVTGTVTMGAPDSPWGFSFDIPYDASNGSISFGNVHRSQTNPQGTNPVPL